MIEQYRSQLESVNKAIAAIEGGAQEYRIGTQSVKYGDLNTLYGQRTRLETMIMQLSSGGITVARIRR